MQESKQREEQASARARQQEFRSLVTAAATKAGVLPTALTDVQYRAQARGFDVADGALGVQKDGVAVLRDDGQPYAITDWLTEQATGDGAHLFKESKGGGTPPGTNLPGGPPKDVEVLRNPRVVQLDRLEDVAKGTAVVDRSVA